MTEVLLEGGKKTCGGLAAITEIARVQKHMRVSHPTISREWSDTEPTGQEMLVVHDNHRGPEGSLTSPACHDEPLMQHFHVVLMTESG